MRCEGDQIIIIRGEQVLAGTILRAGSIRHSFGLTAIGLRQTTFEADTYI